MKYILWILLFMVLVYGSVLLLMYFMQSKMIYHPVKRIVQVPADVGLPYHDVQFKTEDAVQLHGWFVPSESPKGTVLLMHGNAGNISGRLETIRLLHNLGMNAFIFDYRGYGQSEGTPTEQGTYRDATAAWNYLIEEREIEQSSVVIMGRSLGGAIAAELAARTQPAGVIIESTFTSAADLGADLYPWLPVRWLLKYDYETLRAVKKIDFPVLFAHSRDDAIVPYHHGKTLYEAANEPKVFVPLTGPHAGGFLETGASYRNALTDFFNETLRVE